MRPVARIAQSVEQGIENPRILGSIPSPGTTFIEIDVNGRLFFYLKFSHTPSKLAISPYFSFFHSLTFNHHQVPCEGINEGILQFDNIYTLKITQKESLYGAH